jgi:hypothetical protein
LYIPLDAKPPRGVTSEIGAVKQEIAAVENLPHCTTGQGQGLRQPARIEQAGKLKLARERNIPQYSSIESIQYEAVLEETLS